MSDKDIENYIQEHIFEELDEDEFSELIYDTLKE